MQSTVPQGGEDLRGDQRVEQLFDVMNGLLAHHPPAQAADLRVRVNSPQKPQQRSAQAVEGPGWVRSTLEDAFRDLVAA